MTASTTSSSSSVFSSLDKVSASELRGCIAATLGEDVSEEEVAAVLAATTNGDGDGLLDHEKFLRLAGEEEERMRCLREAFGMYAADDNDGMTTSTMVITPTSLRRMLSRLGSQELGVEECRAMICRFDLDGDGVLSFDEFRVMMLMA